MCLRMSALKSAIQRWLKPVDQGSHVGVSIVKMKGVNKSHQHHH